MEQYGQAPDRSGRKAFKVTMFGCLGIVVATVVVVFAMFACTALLSAPEEKPGKEQPGKEQQASLASLVGAQPAQAWYYTNALCDGSFERGDWIQHFYDRNSAHRSTKLSGRYRVAGWVWVDIKKEKVHYRNGRVASRNFVETDAVPCWPV